MDTDGSQTAHNVQRQLDLEVSDRILALQALVINSVTIAEDSALLRISLDCKTVHFFFVFSFCLFVLFCFVLFCQKQNGFVLFCLFVCLFVCLFFR